MNLHEESENKQLYHDYTINDTHSLHFNDYILLHDYGVITTFLRGSGSILLRAGLILIQFGSIPFPNSKGVIVHNVIDLACATIAYCTAGYMFSFGKDLGGIIAWGDWMLTGKTDVDKVILGWSSVITTTGIYTTMFSGRIHYVGNVLITTVFAGIIIPIVMHWTWASEGWMIKATFLKHLVTYKDHGGGMLIHVCGGILALIGSLFLGRRILRLQDVDDASLSTESSANVTIGYLLLILGLIGICLPTPMYELTHEPLNYVGLIFLNNILAATASIITAVVIQCTLSRQLMLHYYSILKYLQGAVAGIVTIASGADVYSPYVSLGLGVAGAFLFYIVTYLMFYTPLEDYANVIAVHLSCGFLSTLLPPLCGSLEGFGVPDKIIIHFAWQIICDLIILAFIVIPTVIIFSIMNILKILRNKDEEKNHQRALLVLDRGPKRNCFQRLWSLCSESQLIEPGRRSNEESQQKNLSASLP